MSVCGGSCTFGAGTLWASRILVGSVRFVVYPLWGVK